MVTILAIQVLDCISKLQQFDSDDDTSTEQLQYGLVIEHELSGSACQLDAPVGNRSIDWRSLLTPQGASSAANLLATTSATGRGAS